MIPKRIFTHWLNPDPVIPPLVQRCIDTQKIPGYEHRVITLENCYRGSTYVNDCINNGRWVKASDWLRIWNLYSEGGIYLDGDMEIMAGKSFDKLLDHRLFLSKDIASSYWANAALGSEAGHSVLKRYLDRVENNYRGSGDDVFSPGIRCFTDIFWEAMQSQETHGIFEYSSDYFFPYNHLTGETLITDNTIVYHHYMKSWKVPTDHAPEKTEFKVHCGNFHIGDQMFALWMINVAARRWPHLNFSFWVEPRYADEFRLLVDSLPNLKVTSYFNGHTPISWWVGDWAVNRRNPDPAHFVDSMIRLQRSLAKNLGLPHWDDPTKEEILLPSREEASDHVFKNRHFDVLFVNSYPLSGQCQGYSGPEAMNEIAVNLAREGFSVVTTHPCHEALDCTTTLGLSLANVGELASRCQFVVGVANAPFIATFNKKAFGSVKKWINYSSDLLNFDDSRVIWARSMDDFKCLISEHISCQRTVG